MDQHLILQPKNVTILSLCLSLSLSLSPLNSHKMQFGCNIILY